MSALWAPTNLSWQQPSCPSRNMHAMLAYIDALQRIDIQGMSQHLHSTFEHRYFPKSLNRPVLNRRQYEEYWSYLVNVYQSCDITIHSVDEAGSDTIILHSTASGKSTTDVQYTNETVISFRFVVDAWGTPKICSMKEFVDTAKVQEFFKEHTKRERQAKEGEQK